jgi:hypothetical protein
LLPLFVLAVLHGSAYWPALLAVIAAVALLQRSLLRFLAAAKGPWLAIRCFPLLLLYNIVCVAGLIAGLLRAERRRLNHRAAVRQEARERARARP